MSNLKNKSSSAQALIQEQLKSRSATRLVNSPHAKYNSRGQLMCVVCGCPVKSAILWQSHVIKKSHIENLKNLQEKQHLLNSAAKRKASFIPPSAPALKKSKVLPSVSPVPVKSILKKGGRSRDDDTDEEDSAINAEPPIEGPSSKRKASTIPPSAPAPKKSKVLPSVSPVPVKSILKKGGRSRDDDTDEEDSAINAEPPIEGPSLPTEAAVKAEYEDEDEAMETSDKDETEDPTRYYLTKADKADQQPQPASDIPEGFFDDPVADAKARKIEYVDKEEAEWNAFMREVSAAETTSRQIIADDTEEAAKRNQILQAEEQMHYYRRILEFDREKKEKESTAAPSKPAARDVESDDSSDEDFKLSVDWRSKKCM